MLRHHLLLIFRFFIDCGRLYSSHPNFPGCSNGHSEWISDCPRYLRKKKSRETISEALDFEVVEGAAAVGDNSNIDVLKIDWSMTSMVAYRKGKVTNRYEYSRKKYYSKHSDRDHRRTNSFCCFRKSKIRSAVFLSNSRVHLLSPVS